MNFLYSETFFTDKRPFFTENQAAFTGSYPGGNLFYTRRVGGPADDGSGASSINAAVKANGNLGALNYAVFGATEDGEAGRDFVLARIAQRSETRALDLTQISVERPFLDRHADVTALHGNFKPNAQDLLIEVKLKWASSTRDLFRVPRVCDWPRFSIHGDFTCIKLALGAACFTP